MNSDSESQDSDDGRRFRFETTRKDQGLRVSTKRRNSPPRSRYSNRRSRSRSRSRDRSSRDERSKYDSSSRKSQSTYEREKSSKDKSTSRESSSKKKHKESRSHRDKDSRDSDSRESKDNNSKHKSKSKEKHKKRSRDRSREKSSKKTDSEESSKKEEKKSESNVESQKSNKRQYPEDSEKVTGKSVDKLDEPSDNNTLVIPDTVDDRLFDTAQVRKKPKSFFDRVVNKGSKNDDADTYGPALPPTLEKKVFEARVNEIKTVKVVDKSIGPVLPIQIQSTETKTYLINDDTKEKSEKIENEKEEETKKESEEDEDDAFGPALPAHMVKKVIGPTLPKDFTIPSDKTEDNDVKNSSSNKEEDENEDDDDDTFGPLPADHPATRDSYVHLQLERRANLVKAKFRNKTSPEKNKREEWMTELPPAHAVALGLDSIRRTFKTSEGPDMSDRSMWTDTPADRLRKQKEKEENRFVPSEESTKKSKKLKEEPKEDDESEKQESLLDLHLKTLKKKKKKLEKEAKELGLSTRRPFDRDVDLQANRLDEARKKRIFQKASQLNDRFTVGKFG